MKKIHQRLLELARAHDLGAMTYRKIAEMLGGEHPYQVQYSIRQLLKSGDLLMNKRTGSIYPALDRSGTDNFITIPVLGTVSCGLPVEFANNEENGFISVSPSLVNGRSPGNIFALKARGDSMNRANIGGSPVDNNDFVVVRKSEWSAANEGDYVVSVLGDYANLKRFYIDKVNQRFILLSESNNDYPPMIIAQEDMEYYKILGVATGVIKALPKPQPM